MSDQHFAETVESSEYVAEARQGSGLAQRLNWLRAGVLGANDGIVSVAAIVVGVAGATANSGSILTAGLAALVGGMVSMALGEYVSVSSQKDALKAHLSAESGIDEDDVVNPWHAAFASAIAFVAGGLLPVLAIMLPPAQDRIPVTFAVVLIALALTGAIGAHLGGSPKGRAALRVVVGGVLALGATLTIGLLLAGHL